MAARRQAERHRHEPMLDEAEEQPRPGLDFSLSAEDRPVGSSGGTKAAGRRRPGSAGAAAHGRREPTFEPSIVPGRDSLARGRADGGIAIQASRRDGDVADQDGKPRAADAKAARRARHGKGRGGGGGGGGGGGRHGKGRRGRSFLGHLLHWTVLVGLWGLIGIGGIVAYQFAKLPPIDQLTVPKRPPNIAIVAADGTLVANRGDTGGRAVSIGELPPYLPKAFVAIEDRRFYSHFGLDMTGIARALFRNITSRGVSQGGSTLTQQLAKNLFLTQERTLSRKIQEAILAVWLERTYSKDQILELYLNRVYFGSGAYGVEAAAQRYFGKSARAVSLAEAAMLGGIVQAPSRLSPSRNPEAAQARAQLVLTAMAQENFISDDKAKTALMTPANAVKPQGAGSVNYAADYVMDVLDDFVGAIESDIVVATTLDPAMQGTAEKALVDELDEKGAKFGVSQGALVTLAPDGAVKALVGGRNYSDSQFNRATTARRQPGSTFKSFVYLAALEHGLTPDTVREDGPVNIKGWQPENFSRSHAGPMTLTTALAQSINTVAVKVGMEVGPKAVARTAQRLGISSPLQPNASIALGTSEVSPLELAAAYTAFANGGIGVIPYVIQSVKTVNGRAIYTRTASNLGRVIDPAQVGMMNSMLREAVITGTAKKADLPGWDVAGKTGTSQDFRDAWFVGYTSQLLTTVWLGNDDGAPTKRASGSNLPVEIWSRYMKSAVRGLTPVPLSGNWRRAPAADPAQQPMAASPDNPIRDASVAYPPGPPGRAGASGGALRPPGNVAGSVPPIPARERNFLERLFGG